MSIIFCKQILKTIRFDLHLLMACKLNYKNYISAYTNTNVPRFCSRTFEFNGSHL